MSLALIQESAKEVRRLSIAGSPLAVGDFRLKKLIPPLEAAGAKVPVFAQVAKAVGDLVNSPEAESPARLLGLSTLLNAILYTQGQTDAEGESRPLEVCASSTAGTRTSARVLKPLIQALTSSGGGRLEIVRAAVDRGAFQDLRLIEPAIRALDDSFPEMADLVAEKVLPAYGPGIVPLLKQKFDLKGKKGDGRRLSLIHQLDPAGSLELCKTALEDGAPEVKASAIACLGKHAECLPLVLEQAKAKNKQLRAAALEALAGHDLPEIVSLFADLLKGKSLELLAGPFRTMRSAQVVQSMLAEGRRVFGLLLKGEQDAISRFNEILNCLSGRQDAEEFLVECLGQCDRLAKLKAPKGSYISGEDLVDSLVGQLYGLGTPKALEAVLAKREQLSSGVFPLVLHSALRTWPSTRVYDTFAPFLEQKKGAGKEKRETLEHTIRSAKHGYVADEEILDEAEADADELYPLRKVEWDPRWVDAGIKANLPVIVACLAQPGHKTAIDYLAAQLAAKNQSECGLIVKALARCGHPGVTRAFLDVVARKTRNARYLDYEVQWLLDSARYLPASDLPTLDAFAAKLDEKFVDKYLEALAPLRTTAPAPASA